MKRFQQLVFVVSLVALSWFAMMAIHELGHVVGAMVTGGKVERVVLHPLTISRTDVLPNPNPLVVVWLGPIIGCVAPILGWSLIPRRLVAERNASLFFAGFCLVANGAYLAFGSIDRIGDCGVMLENGSPQWMLLLFGALAILLGVFAWHRLGSLNTFLSDPDLVQPKLAWIPCVGLIVLLIVEFSFSPT